MALDRSAADTLGVSDGLIRNLFETQPGRIIPALDQCDFSLAEGFRRYREALGQALVAAQDAIGTARGTIAAAQTALDAARGTVDQIIKLNPDPTTPQDTEELMESLGGQIETDDRETLERRVADLYGINVVNGVLFPRGATDITGFRRLFQALALSGECSLPDLAVDFLMVTTVLEAEETGSISTCGETISEFEVSERRIGTNISIARAAELSGKPEDQILVKFFWINQVKTNRATLLRLRALGIVDDLLNTVILAPRQEGRVAAFVLDPGVIAALSLRLTPAEICLMMARVGTGGVNVAPTADEVISTIRDAVNANVGSTANRAGTGGDAITPPEGSSIAPAGRAGSPALFLLATVNLARSLGIDRTEGTVTVDGTPADQDPLDDRCRALFNFIDTSLGALETFSAQAAEFILDLLNIGLGTHRLNAGLGFASCLASINLGLNLSLKLTLGLPFDLQAFQTAFQAALTTTVATIGVIKQFLCIPQSFIQLLFGGLCGFRPFEFNICPPSLGSAVDRVNNLINLASSLVGFILQSIQTMGVSAQATSSAAIDLRVFADCARAAAPLGFALGLAEGQIPEVEVTPTLTPS